MADLIQIRRDTYDNWYVNNPTLALGEIGIITHASGSGSTVSLEPKQCKIGDGTTDWRSLPAQAWAEPGLSGSIDDRINEVSSSLHTDVAASEANTGYVTCGTAAATAAKEISDSVTLAGFVLDQNIRLLVKMTNTNTAASPTLNINSTGAKAITYNGAAASDTNTWAAGEVLDVYYNGTAYVTNTHGGAKFSTGEKVGDVGIDDEPIAGSDNLVKSGGVQNELALGAVYDVSAKNPTAGPNNDGKWTSLSVLLSDANLSTLIPTSVRKGGMSIKFVQSSDNKYVQYMYVGTSNAVADFTNTDNWQKMNFEDEISEINNAKLETFDKEEYQVADFPDWHPEGKLDGYYNTENGTWLTGYGKSVRIDVSGYEQVRFLGVYISSNSQLRPAYAFQDENGNLLTGYPKCYQRNIANTEIYKDYILDIPSGAKYLVARNSSNFYCYLRKGTSVSDRYGNVNRVNLNLNSTVAGFLLEAGTISGGAPNYVKKYDIPEGVKKIYFNGHYVSNLNISLYWIKNAQGTIISHRISASTEDLHNFEIDLSGLEGATQIWTNSNGVPNYIDSEIKIADELRTIENTESIVKSDNIMNSLFFEDLKIASTEDGYLGEDGEVKSSPAGGVIKKFNIPTGTPCLYFTARASFNYLFSVYWIVDNQGNVLKHQACSTSTPNYNNLFIDLTGITGSYQLWTNGFSSSTYNIELTISAYNYNSDVNRRLGKLEDGYPLMEKAPQIIDSLFFYDNKKVVATELGSLKNNGTIYTPYGNEVRKFDIPTGVDKIYFTGKSNYGSAYYSFSSYWIVDENGQMLAHESLSKTPQTYNNHEIDLSGLTGAKQLWTFIMDAYISYYDYTQRVQNDLQRNNQWYGKKIVWLGTSIPWGQSSEAQAGTTRVNPYPYQVCNALGATLVDSTRGGLSQMANYDNDSGLWYPKTYGSTCLTTAECTAAKNAGLVSTDLSAYSYQNTLLGKDADLYIFDVEPNNNDTGSSDDLALFDFYQWKYTDNSTFASHRNTYIGALLYEIDQILTEKPNASFVFIGEHIPWESASVFDTWGVRTVTQALCEKLHAHYINLAEKLCYNGKNKSVWINSDNVHPKQAAYDRMAKILINELLLIA